MQMAEHTDPRLADFLADQVPVAEAWPVWGDGRVPLRQHTYLSPRLPPDEFITSVRAIFFRGDEVMVIQDHQDDPEAIQPDPYVTHAAFQPIEDVLAYDLKDSQKILLKRAVNVYWSKP